MLNEVESIFREYRAGRSSVLSLYKKLVDHRLSDFCAIARHYSLTVCNNSLHFCRR